MSYELSKRNWSQEYRAKLTFADEAINIIEDGSKVHYVFGVPNTLDKALANRINDLKNITIYSHIEYKRYSVQAVDSAGEHFNIIDIPFTKKRLLPDQGDTDSKFKLVKNCVKDSIFMAVVSPMDVNGYFWFAPCVSPLSLEVACRARNVIVEINEYIESPGEKGSSRIHISQVSYIVPGINSPIGKTNRHITLPGEDHYSLFGQTYTISTKGKYPKTMLLN